MRTLSVLLILNITTIYINAQQQDSIKNEIYKLNMWADLPVTLGGSFTSYLGLKGISQKPLLDSLTVAQLDLSNINWFDRSAVRQNPDHFQKAHSISDFLLYLGLTSPFLLMLDEDIREDWPKIGLLFIETEIIFSNLFLWNVNYIDRKRPLLYIPDVPLDTKLKKLNNNSFYSGHTASVAAATFFTAKVYLDYHPELKSKRFLLYSAAIIPPALVGFFRYKAGKHFPTDVLTGLMIGAGTGILVPHLHKQTNSNLVIIPVKSQFTGLALSYKF
ncbi:MAG: phosphatase PAP2 family protein [Bacteroidetes bacterium]|nr:phosphatase PAP2 family protein [Bacteroidota bacterium]